MWIAIILLSSQNVLSWWWIKSKDCYECASSLFLNSLLNWVYWCHILRKVAMPKTIYDHQPWENKTTKGAEGEHMLESKAIKTVISAILTARTLISVPDLDSPQRQFHHVCFPTIYSITLLFLSPLRPCSVFPESKLPLSDWWGKHIWAKSWQLSSFILATHPSVTQQLGGTSAKKKTTGQCRAVSFCMSVCVRVCVPWWVSLWVCVQV